MPLAPFVIASPGLSDNPESASYSTSIPANHPGMARYREVLQQATLEGAQRAGLDRTEAERFIREHADKDIDYISSGPVTFMPNGLPFVRPQLSHMEPLAKALGLDREGGWVDVWKTMGRERKRLCDLVWATLEWGSESSAGNTFTYCFCTKYLPRLITAAIAEPSPSLDASPYDLILRGACNTPILQYYLKSRPDKAIALRNTYYQKVTKVAGMNLTLDDAFARFVPHFIVIHTCVIAYVSSPLSTAAQKAPPVPLDPDAMRAMVPVIDRIRVKLLQGRPSNYLWSGQVEMNLAVFMYAGVAADVLKVCPLLLTAEMGPAGSDFLACRGLGIPAGAGVPVDLNRLIIDEADTLECFVRDPKKMKACSRCKVVYYCCVEHQKHDWEVGMHKPMCQKIVWADV